jgi:hypothetical protein
MRVLRRLSATSASILLLIAADAAADAAADRADMFKNVYSY